MLLVFVILFKNIFFCILVSPDSARIDTRNKYFDINEKNIYEEEVLIKDTGKNKTSNSYTATLTIRICR